MDKFANYSFTKNKNKKRNIKELYDIEKKYNLNDKISKYYMSQWFKFLANDAISYLNINKNKRTNNSIEIFNRYFHKKCNGKGLVTIYELTESIKEEFNEKEYKLISEKN